MLNTQVFISVINVHSILLPKQVSLVYNTILNFKSFTKTIGCSCQVKDACICLHEYNKLFSSNI